MAKAATLVETTSEPVENVPEVEQAKEIVAPVSQEEVRTQLVVALSKRFPVNVIQDYDINTLAKLHKEHLGVDFEVK